MKSKLANKKVALVLAGGSARGFCHVGVLEALQDIGIKPSLIVGTSIGAIIGAMYAKNPDANEIYKNLHRYQPFEFITFDDILGKRGIIKGNKITKMLMEQIGDVKFNDLEIPLIVNATNMRNGTDYVFSKGSVIDAVRASLSIPLVFEPFKKAGKVLVDGGVTSNLFFEILIKDADKYDAFILIDLNNSLYNMKEDFSVLELVIQNLYITQKKIIKQSFEILEKDKSKKAMLFKKKMITIAPDIKDLNGAQFDKRDVFIARGYSAAIKKRKNILSVLRQSA
jgi:NTE family protein